MAPYMLWQQVRHRHRRLRSGQPGAWPGKFAGRGPGAVEAGVQAKVESTTGGVA